MILLLSFHESSGNINPTRLHWYEKYLNQSDSDYNRVACSLVNLCDFLSFAVDTILLRPSLGCPRKDDWILLLMAQTFYSNAAQTSIQYSGYKIWKSRLKRFDCRYCAYVAWRNIYKMHTERTFAYKISKNLTKYKM